MARVKYKNDVVKDYQEKNAMILKAWYNQDYEELGAIFSGIRGLTENLDEARLIFLDPIKGVLTHIIKSLDMKAISTINVTEARPLLFAHLGMLISFGDINQECRKMQDDLMKIYTDLYGEAFYKDLEGAKKTLADCYDENGVFNCKWDKGPSVYCSSDIQDYKDPIVPYEEQYCYDDEL